MLEVSNLSVNYYCGDKTIEAVKDISFGVNRGETLGILGESGSGKSTIAHAILNLISLPGKIVSGKIMLENSDILSLKEKELIKIRGEKISIIFQDPFTSLNPVYSVGEQIAETIKLHQEVSRKQSWEKAIETLEIVQIKDAKIRAKDVPHRFSGGMKQRVMIGMALACQPEYLIADEPTTALDVTIQAEILTLLKDVQKKYNLGIIYITHNFGIIKKICDRVLVVYKGNIAEEGTPEQILKAPQNEYTKKLINCLRELKND